MQRNFNQSRSNSSPSPSFSRKEGDAEGGTLTESTGDLEDAVGICVESTGEVIVISNKLALLRLPKCVEGDVGRDDDCGVTVFGEDAADEEPDC